jgi:hypothetical protein
MAQVKLLKIDSDGVPVEMNTASDDITLNSFTVQGGGPVLSGTGLDMNNKDITEVQDISFQAPTTATINQTAGLLIIDDIMAKERNNVMASTGAVLFPSISGSTANQVDSFKIPHAASAPSVTPSFSSDAGYLVSGNGKLYFWNGTAWDDYSTSLQSQQVANIFDAEGAIADRDCLYINSSGRVDLADADANASSQVCGFAKNSAATQGDDVDVASFGILDGFSSLTVGSRYYLGATAGQISTSVPVGAGQNIVQVGYSKSATELMIMIQQLGRRA